MFFAFGRYHRFLTRAEAALATPEERITSVWPFVVRRTIAFVATLRRRELVSYDADDVLLEVWAELRLKDCKWDPAIGTYVSFSGKIIQHLFARLRELSRTVHSPRNAACRMREYAALAAAETPISPARAKNRDDIGRTVAGASHAGMMLPEREAGDDPEGDCLVREHDAACDDAVRQAVSRLAPAGARVMGGLYGLWGGRVESVAEIALAMGKSPEQVRRIRDNAHRAVRRHLEAQFHPASRDL